MMLTTQAKTKLFACKSIAGGGDDIFITCDLNGHIEGYIPGYTILFDNNEAFIDIIGKGSISTNLGTIIAYAYCLISNDVSDSSMNEIANICGNYSGNSHDAIRVIRENVEECIEIPVKILW